MRAKVLEISWHTTQPVYSADFQPIPAPQLRKILPFPNPTPVATPNPSNSNSISATASTSASLANPAAAFNLNLPVSDLLPTSSIPISTNPGTPTKKADTGAEDGISTPVGPFGGSQPPTSTATPTQTGRKASGSGSGSGGALMSDAGPSTSTSGSGSTPAMGSAGFNPAATRSYRLATAGADSCVRIWTLHPNVCQGPAINPSTGQEIPAHPPRAVYAASLKRHTGAVNVVRWSPTGQYLASAGDDGTIIVWHQVESKADIVNFGEDEEEERAYEKEFWKEKRMIVATKQAIYDLAWSPDGKYIICGSTDNLAQVFSVIDGACVHQVQDHSHYVQGVAWDPLNEYIATQSSDRSVQVSTVTHRNNTLNIAPFVRDRSGRASLHTSMDIRSSRPPSFSQIRPSIARRCSTTSDAGSVITLASELPESSASAMGGSASAAMHASASTPIPSTPLSNMNPPSNRPGSRRSSFSSAAAGSPLLLPATSGAAFRGRSPSPAPLPAIKPTPLTAQTINQKLYGDELATNFFRRLTFSPDGGLLLTPAGQVEEPFYPTPSVSEDEGSSAPNSVPGPRGHGPGSAGDTSKSTVYIYSRANLNKAPIAHLPGHKTTTVAVRFSPIFYELRNIAMPGTGPPIAPKKIILDKKNPNPVHVSLDMPPPPAPSSSASASGKEKPSGAQSASIFALPYRLMYAVAAQDSVLVYDTQQAGPIAIFKGLHYSAFTDIAWSPTGDSLILTSSDGYCSVVVFDANELGPLHPTQQHHRQLQAIAQSHSSGHVGAYSHPPSPAPSNAMPTGDSFRMQREASASSLSISATPVIAPIPLTPSASSQKSDDLGKGGDAEIFGMPVGNASISRPPSSTASTFSLGGNQAIATDSADNKRSIDDVEAEGPSTKKRRIDLTKK